ncbi:EAL domain-containing protein [Sulfurovum sp. ST-21]|uniref:EAL domain-containing protein n=1 Tax=Sulfurovum indicum TaxID=2779528 RepID=A0A7M1S0W3_9BACT|nr:bifunctional diguanylate cyclase/phosphodiesterase [Sulfurovum indicum]QOR61058.1 EAL domain-containing protein [Sulfurovum indicum]
MDKNPLLWALYEISMHIGNTLELKKMLGETATVMLSRLNCSSASVYQKQDNDKSKLLYTKPKVLRKKEEHLSVVQKLEKKFYEDNRHFLEYKVNQIYYYLFELKDFGFLVLTKSDEPLDNIVLKSLTKLNLKLTYAIKACIDNAQLYESKAQLATAQRIAHLGSWTTIFPSMHIHWDDEIFRIFGEEPQSFTPTYRYLRRHLTKKSQKKMRKALYLITHMKKAYYDGVFKIIKRDGSVGYVQIQSKILCDTRSRITYVAGTTFDITKQKQLEQEIRKESNLLKTIINTIPIRIFWKDLESRYLGCNNLFAQDANLQDESHILGKDDYEMPWRSEADMYRAMDKQVIREGTVKLNIEEPVTYKNGQTRWISTSKVPLIDESGKIFGILGTYMDITAKKENERQLELQRDALEHQAYHDALTGLPNRLLFLDRLDQYIHKAHRHKSKVAVLFVDMDRFKEINDSFGHEFGDETIREVSKRLKSRIRSTDTIARFGGDEFIMIFNDINDPLMVVEIVQKIMQSMDEPIIINGHRIYVSLSIGISIYPDDTDTAADLLKNADAAMYKAKYDGRNTYKFYTEDMTEKAFERLALESNLRQAIQDESFMLYFQPQIDGERDRIIGMEALIRWKDKNGEFIPPDKFIPIAEETRLIVPLGEWILRTGMQQMVQWYAKGLNPGKLAINLSMLQLQKHDFVSMLKSMLKETKCQPNWLEIEVTESQIMQKPEQTILTLQMISKLGIGISVDDFGTGYSSLSYLNRFPIDTLKIDQSFINGIPDNMENAAIIQAVIALAKTLNLDVIAEGVETEEQKTFLMNNGCHSIQGYLYARPMPSDKMEKLLKEAL